MGGIIQNKLETALGVEGSIISHWCDEQIDLTAEAVAGIVESLQGIEPSVAENFIRLYLGYPFPVDEDEKVLPFSAVQELPVSNEVDVSRLSKLFEKTTTSYKYLFLISLLDKTKYWRFVLERTSIKCIYSEQSLSPKGFSLDHYIPWSFVAYDQL